jgi:peptidoglycan/LPS O-acetylase OafA/YrhL
MAVGVHTQLHSSSGPGNDAADRRRVIANHIPALDGLRGIAILLVLVNHLSRGSLLAATEQAKLLVRFGDIGWTGVELFFVLSGFLITGILLDSKGADNFFSSFYARRALRILPLSYGALFIGFILCPLVGKLGVPFLPRRFSTAQLWYWFYGANFVWLVKGGVEYFGHFWSLAVEEQFYFLWPAVVLVSSRRTLAKICIALVLLAPLVRILLDLQGVDRGITYALPTSHVDALSFGALAALAVRDDAWARRLLPRLNYFVYPGLIIFIVLGVVYGSVNWDDSPAFIVGALPLAIFFTGLLLRAVATTGSTAPFQQFLRRGWLRSCGRYSYAVYVLHVPLLVFYFNKLVPAVLKDLPSLRGWAHHPGMLGSAVLALLFILHTVVLGLFFFGLGKFSWWAFEGPLNGLKPSFKPRFDGGQYASPAIELAHTEPGALP